MNQEEDRNHVTWIVKLDRDSGPAVVTERVVGAARNMKGMTFDSCHTSTLTPTATRCAWVWS
jgi:hypothetical protein